MFPAMAGSILSASTFGVPLLTYLRNRISCFKFPKEPFAWMPWFSWKGRLHPWGFVPNLPVCISGRSWQSGVSLFFLLKVFYSDSLWYIRFYRGICCSPYIYRLFFCSHSLFCFSNVWYGLPSAFSHSGKYRYPILHDTPCFLFFLCRSCTYVFLTSHSWGLYIGKLSVWL